MFVDAIPSIPEFHIIRASREAILSVTFGLALSDASLKLSPSQGKVRCLNFQVKG